MGIDILIVVSSIFIGLAVRSGRDHLCGGSMGPAKVLVVYSAKDMVYLLICMCSQGTMNGIFVLRKRGMRKTSSVEDTLID